MDNYITRLFVNWASNVTTVGNINLKDLFNKEIDEDIDATLRNCDCEITVEISNKNDCEIIEFGTEHERKDSNE